MTPFDGEHLAAGTQEALAAGVEQPIMIEALMTTTMQVEPLVVRATMPATEQTRERLTWCSQT